MAKKGSAAAIRGAVLQSPVTKRLSKLKSPRWNVSPAERFRHALSSSFSSDDLEEPSSFPPAIAVGDTSASPAQQTDRRATWMARGISLKAPNLPVTRLFQRKTKPPDSRRRIPCEEGCTSSPNAPACEPAQSPAVQMPEVVSAEEPEPCVSSALARARGQSPDALAASSISGVDHTNESMAESASLAQARWLTKQVSNVRRASASDDSLPAEDHAPATCNKNSSSMMRV